MEKAIRHKDGQNITPQEWRTIRAVAKEISRTKLLILPRPRHIDPAIPKTKAYFKQHFPAEWADATTTFNRREPLMRLCGGSWKSDYTLGSVLLGIANQEGSGLEERPVPPTSSSGSSSDKRKRAHSEGSKHRKKKAKAQSSGTQPEGDSTSKGSGKKFIALFVDCCCSNAWQRLATTSPPTNAGGSATIHTTLSQLSDTQRPAGSTDLEATTDQNDNNNNHEEPPHPESTPQTGVAVSSDVIDVSFIQVNHARTFSIYSAFPLILIRSHEFAASSLKGKFKYSFLICLTDSMAA
jgi:hypothetical protein